MVSAPDEEPNNNNEKGLHIQIVGAVGPLSNKVLEAVEHYMIEDGFRHIPTAMEYCIRIVANHIFNENHGQNLHSIEEMIKRDLEKIANYNNDGLHDYDHYVWQSIHYGIICTFLGLPISDNAIRMVNQNSGEKYYIDAPNIEEDDVEAMAKSDFFTTRDMLEALQIIHG